MPDRRSPVEELLAEPVTVERAPNSSSRSNGSSVAVAARIEVDGPADSAAQAHRPAAQDEQVEQGFQDSPTRPHVAGGARAEAPPVQDVALGLASLVAETLWRIGASGVGLASAASARVLAVVRAITPQAAAELTDASLQSLAVRGRRVRAERTEAMTELLTTAMANASANPAVREVAVAAIGEATEEVLAVVLPSVLDAMSQDETQERLDELMAGLLVRQMPAALEKTLPGVMLRTATKPALGIVPSVMGALRPTALREE